jgi:ribonuclease G
VRRLERSLKRASQDNHGRRMTVRLHPEVALYLLEEEPHFLKTLAKQTAIDLEVRDDPMMKLDELKLMSQPAGRDVTESYLVA